MARACVSSASQEGGFSLMAGSPAWNIGEARDPNRRCQMRGFRMTKPSIVGWGLSDLAPDVGFLCHGLNLLYHDFKTHAKKTNIRHLPQTLVKDP
jgi:hypothetical protein